MIKKVLIVFLIVVLIFLHIGTNVVIAKYIFESLENLKFKVEKPVIEIVSDNNKNYTIDSNEVEYKFKILNYDKKENVNNLDIEYYIELISNKLNFFNIKLQTENEELKLENNKTKCFNLLKNEKKEDNFYLYIELKDNFKDDFDLNLEDSIQIKINFCQKNI